ncbi:2Fe-2S iron-sulfur cluster-binding protein [Kaarinaea lacus]
MALINFSSPEFKDKTVYAVAGSHTETVLKIAKSNKIPIDFSCENGECGSCVIRVKSVNPDKPRMGYHLTEKEKTVLLEVGKLTREDMEKLIVDDLPSEWRLACQFIPRDEDVLVEY